uniref:Pseudouridine synthase family protein n=1 Tax=Rhizophora mucronata TaxID=61149 RepID=A0A2P2KV31_RHIMU
MEALFFTTEGAVTSSNFLICSGVDVGAAINKRSSICILRILDYLRPEFLLLSRTPKLQ